MGDGASHDRPSGMETELVALTNPYADDPGTGVRVPFLYQGQPRADPQLEIIEKAADDTVTIQLLRTDS